MMDNGHKGHLVNASGKDDEDIAFKETDLIETTDEEGVIHLFEKVSELEVDDQEYALLIYRGKPGDEPKPPSGDDDEDEDELVIMRLSYEDGQEVFEAIEDEEEFERIVAYIEEMEEEEDDDDEELEEDKA